MGPTRLNNMKTVMTPAVAAAVGRRQNHVILLFVPASQLFTSNSFHLASPQGFPSFNGSVTPNLFGYGNPDEVHLGGRRSWRFYSDSWST